jgi:hypothetical protein
MKELRETLSLLTAAMAVNIIAARKKAVQNRPILERRKGRTPLAKNRVENRSWVAEKIGM